MPLTGNLMLDAIVFAEPKEWIVQFFLQIFQ
jgi:hypothetical protein